ncbi:MAG: hypothetical protein KIG61_05740 [Muribaculaceae bacterium]|nr:hypothetical protein [Muribaculaceae bacterium]
MNIFLLVASILLWVGSIWCLYGRLIVAPALSLVALFLLSLMSDNGVPLLPINGVMLSSWFALSLLVAVICYLQPEQISRQTRGMLYIIVGGFTGMALGMLGYSVTSSVSLRYSCMALSIAAGIIFGFLLYTYTPQGQQVKPGSGFFVKYLLAKGFPTLVTLMQMGIALVIAIAMANVNAL